MPNKKFSSKWLLSLLLLLVGILSVTPVIDQRAAAEYEQLFQRAFITFALARTINGVISVLQGTNESAGKRKSATTGHGNRWLQSTLVQVAWAASRKKQSYFQAQFRRLSGRRGKKRAIVAVAHSILTDTYHILKAGASYRELGGDLFDRLHHDRIRRYHVKRLQDLGYPVVLGERQVA